jgi:hypothetical protein
MQSFFILRKSDATMRKPVDHLNQEATPPANVRSISKLNNKSHGMRGRGARQEFVEWGLRVRPVF